MTAPLVAITDVGIHNGLRTLMRSASYRAETLAPAEAFVAREITAGSDCAIPDVSMQDMSGFELADLLKSRGCTASVIRISALNYDDLELGPIQRYALPAP